MSSAESKELVVEGKNWKGTQDNGYLPRTRTENGNGEAGGALLEGVATTVVHLGSGGAPRTMLHHGPPRNWPLRWERCLIFSVFVLFFTSAISLLLLLTSNTCDLSNIGKLRYEFIIFVVGHENCSIKILQYFVK